MAYKFNIIPTGTVDGVNTTFTAPSVIDQIVLVTIDGAIYTGTITVSGASITFADAPTVSVYIWYYDSGATATFSGILVSDIKTEFSTFKGNLGGAGDTEFFQWINWLQEFMYPKLYNTNPEDYLTNRFIKTIASTGAYAYPSAFETMQIGGIYKTVSGDDYQALNFDGQTTDFVIGETLTGSTSGATGTIAYQTDYGMTGTLILAGVTGTFVDNEAITSSSGSATANGGVQAFDLSDSKLSETGFGSTDEGYWMDESYVYITPTPSDANDVYVMRYVPRITPVSSTSDATIFSTKYKEFLTHAMETYWSMWRQNGNNEFMSGQRYKAALLDLLRTVKRTPRIIKCTSTSSLY
jgi:hypothetical protein